MNKPELKVTLLDRGRNIASLAAALAVAATIFQMADGVHSYFVLACAIVLAYGAASVTDELVGTATDSVRDRLIAEAADAEAAK